MEKGCLNAFHYHNKTVNLAYRYMKSMLNIELRHECKYLSKWITRMIKRDPDFQ